MQAYLEKVWNQQKMRLSHKIIGKILGDKTSKNDAYPVMSTVSNFMPTNVSNTIYTEAQQREEYGNQEIDRKKKMAALLKKRQAQSRNV